MKRYLTTNHASAAHMDFSLTTNWSRTKSQREDFNDMFKSEADYRKYRGDKSIVFCLTYNNENLHKFVGRNVLYAPDLKVFSKAGSYVKCIEKYLGLTFDFVAVGEYGEGGKTHGYVGKRGAGNNPHYHCVGWYHHCDQSKSPEEIYDWLREVVDDSGLLCESDDALRELSKMPPYDLAVVMLRYYWQRSFENDPMEYAQRAWYKDHRLYGKGYVKLQGEIITSKGGSYISKYLGKQISSTSVKLFYSYWAHFTYSMFLAAIFRYCRENKLEVTYADATAIIDCWLSQSYTRNNYVSQLLSAKIPMSSWYHHTVMLNFQWFKCISPKHYTALLGEDQVDGILDNVFKDNWHGFVKRVRNEFSPKVRKFHQFGYHLLENADVEHGTYTILKGQQPICRELPPSLKRFVYYDHKVCTVDSLEGITKTVVYYLNETGRRYLRCKLLTRVAKDAQLYRSHCQHSDVDPLVVSRVANCLIGYDVVFDSATFDNIFNNIKDCTMACINYAVNCHQCIVFEERTPEDRQLLDVENFFITRYPAIYKAVKQLNEYKKELRAAHDVKSMDWLVGSINNVLNNY